MYDNEKSKQTFGIQYKDIYQTIKETSTQFLDHVHRNDVVNWCIHRKTIDLVLLISIENNNFVIEHSH